MKEDGRTSAELVLKILLVGAPKSGKTSLVRRLCDKSFREDYFPTLGFEVVVVPFGTYQGRPVKLHLWDVAGSQLNAKPCHHALIGDGAEGVLYVMDVTNRESLQAVDDWDRALSPFLPSWTCKLLVGHKADLPVYVVNDEALSLYVAGAQGFRGWCLTVGSSEYGDYDVAARRGGGGATADVGGRYKGQSLSGEKQLSVSEAVRTLIGHVFRAGGAGGPSARQAGVLGLGASAGGATPLPCATLDATLETIDLLGLGGQALPSDERSRVGAQVDARARGSMTKLLKKGRGPEGNWRGGVEVTTRPPGDEKSVANRDAGWQYFAGRMGREEAEALLRGKPEGTFFLRRKAPSILLLTYVAKAHGGPGSGRKSSAGHHNDWMGKSLHGGGGSKRQSSAGAQDLGDAGTSVQHALLVHESGFFSDERGRLGLFPTLDELLKSKISALARHPLSFRREQGRYVLIDPAKKGAKGEKGVAPYATAHLAPAGPSPSNPFAVDDEMANLMPGAPASTLAPVATGGLFGGREHPTTAMSSTSIRNPVPLPPPPPLSSTSGSSPRANAESLFEQSSQERRHSPVGSRSGTTSGGDWIDNRVSRTKSAGGGGFGGGGGAVTAPSGSSLWMEAAAAVRKSSLAGGSSEGAQWPARQGPVSSSGRSEADAAHATGNITATSSTSRRRTGKGSVSSTDDGASVSSSSVAEAREHADLRSPLQRKPSAMDAAAEVAAAVTAARGHPDAKRVEERTLAAEVAVNRAAEVLERGLKQLVVRRQPPADTEPHAPRRGVTSAYSSPRGPGSPSAKHVQAAEERQPQWIVSSPEGIAAAAAPLAGVAVLLMDRACLRQRHLLSFAHKLRERAVSLARAEAAPIASAPGLGSVSTSPRDQGFRVRRQLFGSPTGAQRSNGGATSSHDVHLVMGGGIPTSDAAAGGGTGPATAGARRVGAGRANPTARSARLSCCLDFELILGEEGSTSTSKGEAKNAPRGDGEGVSGLFLRANSGRADPLSDSSVVAEYSSSAFERSTLQSGQFGTTEREIETTGGLSIGRATEPSPDSWEMIFRDVVIAEERCRDFMADFEAAGGALRDACEDEAGDGDVDWLAEGVAVR